MNISQSIPSSVTSVAFSFLTAEDIRRISVKQIVNPVLLDDNNRPNHGGLYDPALGPADRKDICSTCRGTSFSCPGHYGHIELPAPVFHPLFMNHMYNVLRATCLYCHNFKLARPTIIKYIARLRLLEYGLLEASEAVAGLHLQANKKKSVDMDIDSDEPDEPVEAFASRIQTFVQLCLYKATQAGTKRDAYKDSLVFQARKDLITEFMKESLVKRCNNPTCGAFGYTFRKEGHTKVIEYDLSQKQKTLHETLGLERPRVLQRSRLDFSSSKRGVKRQRMSGGSDAETSDSEPEPAGEATFSDEEDAQPQNLHKTDGAPRAVSGATKTSRGRNERIMSADECREHLRRLFTNERELVSLIFGRHGPLAPVDAKDNISVAHADMFFMEVLCVPPTRFRPPAKMGETIFEHPQNELLTRIINTTFRLRDVNQELARAEVKGPGYDKEDRDRCLARLIEALQQLQIDVNSFIDSNKNPQPVRQGKLPPPGIKQGLEKKEGLFRKNMMGKRVNYAARSVISPDVNIEPNEIGVPPVFARKLTFPEPVTATNFHEMRQLVINGPKIYPGASIVENEDGSQIYLDKLSTEQRTAIANQLMTPQEGGSSSSRLSFATRTPSLNKKVYRHLRDGDMLILNRQPTLHKPSMMAHRARVLQGEKTIRMHYANCNSYNADFDGDEMNIHFPQNEVARAEAMLIANTDNQYLVPTSGKPLRGLIQDHVVAGVWMTNKDTFFTREQYFQLLYGSLRPEEESHETGRVETLPPTIWKPQPLWTGKQIISTILLNITPGHMEGLNLHGKAKVAANVWGKWDEKLPTEADVIFQDGELLCGVLDKSAFGATDYGLVHSVYELYGSDTAGRLLGILSRLFTKFLQMRAFTCRMDDLTLTPSGNAARTEIIAAHEGLGTEGAIENFPSLADMPEHERQEQLERLLRDVLRDDEKMAGLDMTVKTKLAALTKKIADAVMPHGLSRKFPHNHMQAMTQSGAKGSAVNAQQISCALGQQELEGRRVPVMISGKTLPSFKAFETKAIAGGYVASRFLTGVKPQEFFFHCMAGREGLIDTAVKTSRSGYLQRSLIKHLEGLRVHYDNTVRGSDDSVYQFFYGGDALDVTKQKHLYQFEFIARNIVSLSNRYQPAADEEVVGASMLNDRDAVKYMKKVLKKPAKRAGYDTAMASFNPSQYLGATSEKFAEALYAYVEKNPDGLIDVDEEDEEDEGRFRPLRKHPLLHSKQLRALMWLKYMRSMVEPGEAVGLLAGQGVGEPSTQMTLNTFHFAGHGAANVTLGIPRLREIVMTASTKPKTPSMTMIMASSLSQADVDAFAKSASRLLLSQIVDTVTVTERMAINNLARSKIFRIAIKFFPDAEYRVEHDTSPREVLASFAVRFPLLLRKEIANEMKKLELDLKSQINDLGKGRNAPAGETARGGGGDEDEGGDEAAAADDASDAGDGDATSAKRQRQKTEQATYEDDSDSDAERERDDEADFEAAFASDGSVMSDDEGQAKKPKLSARMEAAVQAIEQSFLDSFPSAKSFSFTPSECVIELEFGTEFPKLLLVGIVEKACLKTVVREIPGIADCFRVRDTKPNEPFKVTTNGSNFKGIWQFTCAGEEDMIDTNSMYSNDIYAILKTYGVEMARAAIVQEMSGVFGVYKIDVDLRHLELIADYMTFEGGYKPFNRKGIGMHPSPLLKASFETTAAFISDATLYGDFDDMKTPSSNLVVGRPSLFGTGVFDVVAPLS